MGEVADIVFMMVLNGKQVWDVVTSDDGLLQSLRHGTLIMMVSAQSDVYERNLDVLKAVGEKILHVGEEAGICQTVKASLQALIGASFAAVFESLVLAGLQGWRERQDAL